MRKRRCDRGRDLLPLLAALGAVGVAGASSPDAARALLHRRVRDLRVLGGDELGHVEPT